MNKASEKLCGFLKFYYGDIMNHKTGKKMDVIVRYKRTWPMIVGIGLIATGVKIMSVSSFKSGADAYMNEELQVLEKLSLAKL